ncbi:MAG TPA: branched-chain amino acid ABC transporter permease [Xanthobacteraceae bacterium]|nr:branched-chain amino acid ABC transporter permease [Xanthobacteraceae bacterium]
MLDPIILLQIAWTGIAISSYYVLFTIAFSLALKVMQLWNFAQAGLMALAFYAMFFALNRLALPLPLGIAFGVAVTVIAAVALEVFGLRTLRARRSGNLTFFIFTLIVAEFVAYLLMMIFGTEPQTLFPSILSKVHIVMNIAVSNWDLIAVGTTLACVAALWAFLRFHQDGQFMLAVAENAALAELYGISAKRAYLVTMIIVAIISCAGMYLFGSRSGVFPTTPLELLLVAVIATLLGGMGRIFAAGIAAVALGLIQSFSVLVISSQWQTLVLYAFLFVTIIFFPLGFRLPLWLRKAFKPAA